MTRCFLLCCLLSACRFLAPVSPAVSPARPGLLSPGASADPTRQQALPGRPCVVACGPGHRCDERTARCEPAPGVPPRDGGAPWLP